MIYTMKEATVDSPISILIMYSRSADHLTYLREKYTTKSLALNGSSNIHNGIAKSHKLKHVAHITERTRDFVFARLC